MTTTHLVFQIVSQINERLAQLIPSGPLEPAMRYALLGKGKRVRPILTCLTAQLFGVSLQDALDPACAIEMVHIYSLIHDDLPCMDDDDLRRGEPTLHRVFPESIALLAGDALLSESFRVILCTALSPSMKILLLDRLTERIGAKGMAGGQALEMLQDPNIQKIQQQKTGDLLSCCTEFGALLGNAPDNIQKEMRQMGLDFGLAYQIQDDWVDEEETSGAEALFKKTFQRLIGRSARSPQLMYFFQESLRFGLSKLTEFLHS